MRAQDVNVAAAVATCPACSAVFSIAQKTRAPQAEPLTVIPDAFAPSRRMRSEPVGGYRESTPPGVRRWELRWFRWPYLLFIPFFGFWDSIVGVFVVASIGGHGFGWGVLLMPHLWVGIIGPYVALAHLLDRSRIELGREELSVKHGPLPWPGVRVPRSEIVDVDASQGGWPMGGTGNRSSWQVRVIGPDRRARKILGALNAEEASYLAAELRRALHDPDI